MEDYPVLLYYNASISFRERGFVDKVISADGTSISFQRSGSGQALVLVHGTGADHTRWDPVLPSLGKHFTLYAVDRRGRGQSGDAPAYAMDRESVDIAAVVESIGGRVNLLGHSYGALCCLEAALCTGLIHKLILYEPPVITEGFFYPSGVLEHLRLLLNAGDREGVLNVFLHEIVGMPEDEVALLRSEPSWESRLAAAHTIFRELPEEGSIPDLQRFHSLSIPVLLLLGGDSPPALAAATKAVHAAIRNSRILVMPGQQHIAMNTAPELFVREVVKFLTEPD